MTCCFRFVAILEWLRLTAFIAPRPQTEQILAIGISFKNVCRLSVSSEPVNAPIMILDTLFQNPVIFVVWLAAIIIPIALHEFAHALAATAQGDPTPKSMGRLTLNPLAHIDPLGILLLLVAGFGWGKPTPYNPLYLKNRRYGPALIAAAGPILNVVLIIVFGVFLKLVANLGPDNLLVIFLVALIQINIVLMLFNLLPIPPLDGSKVLFSLLPASSLNFQARFERFGPMLLLGLVLIDQFASLGIFRWLFSGISNFVFSFF